ncbi:MAG TPA: hypothetical protein PKW33_02355 [Anaerolineaceae bacterium]|nr:hypothetical protein [Anaerolineaceae bacterium]HPN50402.1 hypothetical protein [Anaerolineaceae bacterium]
MLLLLPLTVFIALYILFSAYQRQKNRPDTDWRSPLIQTAATWGAWMTLTSEGLSLFHGLNAFMVSLSWAAALVWVLIFGWRLGLLRLPPGRIGLTRFDGLALAGAGLVMSLLLVVAILSPTNNNDALQYHMPRVAHWIQNGGLQHYVTAYDPQLMNPIWAELPILHFYLLWGSDQMANLVQWLSLLGCLALVAGLARLLGAGRLGQWLAAAFGLSLPMALLQASSSQNDLVAAFWLLGMLYFAVLSARRDLFPEETLALALCLALGLLTKGTFYPYALPVVIWLLAVWLRRRKGLAFLAAQAGINGLAVLVLNLGYWVRNTITYGGPLGSSDWVANHTAGQSGVLPFLAALTRDVLMNFVTPFDSVNAALLDGLRAVFGSVDPNLAEFQFIWSWNRDDLAGSPLHFLLIALTIILLWAFRKKWTGRLQAAYALLSLSLLACLVGVLHFDQYGMRYQLPFLMSWAAVFGLAVEAAGRRRLAQAAVFLLFLYALPYALINRTRPLIAMRDNSPDPFTIPCVGQCTSGSILLELAEKTVFGSLVDFREGFLALSRDLLTLPCREVGLQIDSHDPEYLFWFLLKAPQSGYKLEVIYTTPPLERYRDPAFKPCAIICTFCGDKTRLHGLELYQNYGSAQLFTGSAYTVAP